MWGSCEQNQWEFRLILLFLHHLLDLIAADGNHHGYSTIIVMDFDAGIPISRASVTEGPSSLDQGLKALSIYLSILSYMCKGV